MAINPLPNNFRGKYPSSAIASYSYYDLATGIAYKTLYPTTSLQTSSTVLGIVTTTDVYSYPQIYSSNGANQANDFDYDITFNVPTRVKGDCFISIPIGYGGSSASVIITFTASLYKVVGVTETLLGTTATESKDLGFGAQSSFIWGIKTNIPLTSFKSGDKLRLNVTSTSAGSARTVYFFNDPANRTTAMLNNTISQAKINLPIKISK